MPLNRRSDCRFEVRHIGLPQEWEIVELSRAGALIVNRAAEFAEPPEPFAVQIGPLVLQARPIWVRGAEMGVAFTPGIEDVKVPRIFALRPHDESFPAMIQIPADEFSKYSAEDTICTLVNFMVELDSPSTDINKLKSFIEQIGELGSGDDAAAAEPPQAEPPEGKPKPLPPSSRLLKQVLMDKACEGGRCEGVNEVNIDFAISLLGLEQLKSVTRGFAQKKLAQVSSSMKSFKSYSAYTTLKTVLFNRISQLFGYQDPDGEGASILQFETAGIEALINRSSGVLDAYYTSATRVYSNMSRRYERALFGKDLIEVNRHFFDNLGEFDAMYGGYVMAHQALNMQYLPSPELKITINKDALNFSLVAHMTFLGLKFAMDRDRVSGLILIQKLMGRGLNSTKAGDFVNDCVSEANKVLDDFGMKGKIGVASPPPKSSIVLKYLPETPRYKHIIDTFRNFEQSQSRRLALRYEDSSYAHFILRRLINDPDCLLSRRASCVVPCANLSERPLYLDDFSNFDLLIFKDIDRLPSNHVRDFIRIWNSFEGSIVVTFDKFSFIDYTLRPLYTILKDNVVDFPSYFAEDETYRRMVGHTLECLVPYLGGKAPEYAAPDNGQGLFLDRVYTMDYIFSRTFLTKEII